MAVNQAGATTGRFVYGPIPSRRLGFSLGVDILPYKTCSLDCIYCQLGPTRRTAIRRRAFFSAREVVADVRRALASGGKVDVISFSGSGEPTLNRNLGGIIRSLKKITRVPIAVLTNGTLLTRKDVRRDLAAADIVVPSLDAVPGAVFEAVNRPHASLRAGRIVQALALFRKEFKGQIWLEVMLVKGTNDSPAHIRALKAAIDRITPDKVQLNTVVRPPAEKSARPLTARELERIRRALGDRAEVVAAFAGRPRTPAAGDLKGAIASVLRRRPVTAQDISASLGCPLEEVAAALRSLVKEGTIKSVRHGRNTYYEPA